MFLRMLKLTIKYLITTVRLNGKKVRDFPAPEDIVSYSCSTILGIEFWTRLSYKRLANSCEWDQSRRPSYCY